MQDKTKARRHDQPLPVREAAMKVTDVDVKKLKPWDRNPRIMSRHDMESLKKSIREHGFVEPVVATKSGLVVGGHQRLEAAMALGMKKVPVITIDYADSDPKVAALNIALNRVHGDWDEPKLEALLADLKTDGMDMALTGFTTTELDKMLVEFAGPLPESGVARGDGEIGGASEMVEFTVHLSPPDYAAVMNALAKTGRSTQEEQLVELARRL